MASSICFLGPENWPFYLDSHIQTTASVFFRDFFFSEKDRRNKSDLLPCVFHRVLDRISIFNQNNNNNEEKEQFCVLEEIVFIRMNFERRRCRRIIYIKQ